MDLWIRSQDKSRLGKIVYIELQEDDYGYHLMGWRDRFDGTRIATYKTKERALEVLDDINSIILGGVRKNSYVSHYTNIIVYEMPQE